MHVQTIYDVHYLTGQFHHCRVHCSNEIPVDINYALWPKL